MTSAFAVRHNDTAPATIVTAFYEEGDDRIAAVLAECGYEVRYIRYAVEIWDLATRPAGHLFANPAGDPYHLELHGTSIWFADLHETCRQRHLRRNPGSDGIRPMLSGAEMDEVFRAVLREAIAGATPKG